MTNGAIAVDTNVVVRLLVRDDELQYRRSVELFQRDIEIFISNTVVLETEWVLRFAYSLKPSGICQGFRYLFGLPNVQLSDPHALSVALQWHESGLDFADALHLALARHCQMLYTFDKKFEKRSRGLSACQVLLPPD